MDLLKFEDNKESQLLTIKEASNLASKITNKSVTTSNISYLIQYGRVKKIVQNNITFIDKNELIEYYKQYMENRQVNWKDKLGDDLNWHLSFDNLKETDTTKHVHRLHPYKGKFIPQLVEYFLDSNVDDFKKEVYFKKNDIILDPFCGSGTTLVQACELGMNALGIDISAFNTLISNIKLVKYNFYDLQKETQRLTIALKHFVANLNIFDFEKELSEKLSQFNNIHFPAHEFKYKIKHKEIDGDKYGAEKEKDFLPIYKELVNKYSIKLRQETCNNFLDKWYLHSVRLEIDFLFDLIKRIENPNIINLMSVILSRTIRSCRATTHSDLATLKEPILSTYYCSKHGKLCKPLFSILNWWETYCKDTLKRLIQFDRLRTNTHQICVIGDSKNIDIIDAVKIYNIEFADLIRNKKIKGIFTSPPYVGLIDYHEQHAYAYDLFGFERKDELEIGSLKKGQGKVAQKDYVEEISSVFNNCKRFLVDDYDIFIVANDKYNLYPIIAEKTEMKIVNQFKRPVLNRSEKDKNAYSEIIFHLKSK